jgi:hypothetical protein
MVHEFWSEMPPSYRFNVRLNRYEELFEDWDCSVEGFEGIRSQDILSLLLRDFHFRFFLPFANIIDPFVDRAFGYHFDADSSWDRAFIDWVHRRDEAAISSGALTPTHMLAVVSNRHDLPGTFAGNLSPEFCVRNPDKHFASKASPVREPYHPRSWPHSPDRELEISCRRLADATTQTTRLEAELRKRTEWAHSLESNFAASTRALQAEFDERTAWALQLREELSEKTRRISSLQAEVEEQTEWALRLSTELDEKRRWTSLLQSEWAERTARVLQLQDELADKTRALAELEKDLHTYLHNPIRLFSWLIGGFYRRLLNAISSERTCP